MSAESEEIRKELERWGQEKKRSKSVLHDFFENENTKKEEENKTDN